MVLEVIRYHHHVLDESMPFPHRGQERLTEVVLGPTLQAPRHPERISGLRCYPNILALRTRQHTGPTRLHQDHQAATRLHLLR
jgi:hypothetical protein